VTFSNRKVAEVVNAKFVPAWFNRSPGFRNTDDQAEKSIFQGASEAFLTKNICTFVLTPDGRVFHYMAGYVSPELFLRFLDDALVIRRAGFDDRMAPKAEGLEALRRVHAALAASYENEGKNPSKPAEVADRTYRDATHRHSDACSWQIQQTWLYLGRVHRSWEKSAALPALEEIRFKYLYGNDFSEEGQGATPIAADPTILTGLK
jgi:hypothetical protein